MKKLFLIALFILSVPASSFSQSSQSVKDTRVLTGVQTGSSFGNLFVGVISGVDIPLKHFEFEARDVFSPVEQHVALGNGTANQVLGTGTIWIKDFGFDGGAEYSSYHVSIKKSAEYAYGGFVLRRVAQGIPLKFTFNYLQEFNNGIFPNTVTGTETPHLKAGDFTLAIRVACHGNFCFRTDFDFKVGHVLTQSNPVCDGTFGVTGGPNGGACPRVGASSGSFTGALIVEFPRHNKYDVIDIPTF